jgi:hypothetical protein
MKQAKKEPLSTKTIIQKLGKSKDARLMHDNSSKLGRITGKEKILDHNSNDILDKSIKHKNNKSI